MSTFVVRGVRCRTESHRRFVVFSCRPAAFEGRRWDGRAYVPETFRAFPPQIIRRSDDAATAQAAARRYGTVPGGWVVTVDTVTGEEI